MTLDEQDIINGALNRLHTASICIGEGYTEGRALEGALFVISDVKDILATMLEDAAREKAQTPKIHIVN